MAIEISDLVLFMVDGTRLRTDSQPDHACQFCSDHMSGFNHFNERGLTRLDTVHLRDTENFFVIPDSLPVHPEGYHVVMIPRKHVFSYAQLPAELGEEAQAIVTELETALEEELVLFEHGGTKHGGKVQSVYHAHAHLIGSGGHDVLSYMEEVFNQEGITNYERTHANHSITRNIERLFKGQNYFYIQQNGEALIAHDPDDSMPSQLAQRNMSLLLTGEVVNWKEIPANSRFADLSIERINKVVSKLGLVL